MIDKEKRMSKDDEDLMELCTLIFKTWDNTIINIARTVLEHYQPKLPEGSVVLSKEDFWKLSNKFSKKEVDKIVEFQTKKTAEKFAKDIFIHITSSEVWEKLRQLWLNKDGNTIIANKHIYDLLIRPIAKNFGVELKE